jgi:hypothetical protein
MFACISNIELKWKDEVHGDDNEDEDIEKEDEEDCDSGGSLLYHLRSYLAFRDVYVLVRQSLIEKLVKNCCRYMFHLSFNQDLLNTRPIC